MADIEPIDFIGAAAAPILFINAREDLYVPAAAAEAYQAAAGPNAEVVWFDSGHDLPIAAYELNEQWTADQLGLDPSREAECRNQIAGH